MQNTQIWIIIGAGMKLCDAFLEYWWKMWSLFESFRFQKFFTIALFPVSLKLRIILISGIRLPKSSIPKGSWRASHLKFTAKKSDNQSVPVLPAESVKIVSGLALVIIKAQKWMKFVSIF